MGPMTIRDMKGVTSSNKPAEKYDPPLIYRALRPVLPNCFGFMAQLYWFILTILSSQWSFQQLKNGVGGDQNRSRMLGHNIYIYKL